MDPIAQLWNQLQSYLQLTHICTEKEGRRVNVGESFGLKITLTNRAPQPTDKFPLIRFKTPRLRMQGTYFAELATGQSPIVPLPDVLLAPGESTFVTVKMKAIHDLPDIIDIVRQETVLKVTVMAMLDLDGIANSVIKKNFEVHEEVYEPVLT